jgi:hypothetical protein
MGNYLTDLWKESKNEKSFQLSKDSGMYVVRMVVDEDKLRKDSTADAGFTFLKLMLQSQVFDNNAVRFVLTDEYFKDIKTY